LLLFQSQLVLSLRCTPPVSARPMLMGTLSLAQTVTEQSLAHHAAAPCLKSSCHSLRPGTSRNSSHHSLPVLLLLSLAFLSSSLVSKIGLEVVEPALPSLPPVSSSSAQPSMRHALFRGEVPSSLVLDSQFSSLSLSANDSEAPS